jgi:hypothetical protein
MCDYIDINFDEDNITPGLYVSLQCKDTSTVYASLQKNLAQTLGTTCPMDMPTSPVDVNGYGTAGLASDQGNVLIVQQTNGNKQWRANELKRCTRY